MFCELIVRMFLIVGIASEQGIAITFENVITHWVWSVVAVTVARALIESHGLKILFVEVEFTV